MDGTLSVRYFRKLPDLERPVCPLSISAELGDREVSVLKYKADSSISKHWEVSVEDWKLGKSVVLLLTFQLSNPDLPLSLLSKLRGERECDVTFNFPCGGSVKAHKLVLRAASNQFDRVFLGDTFESSTTTIQISDFTIGIFKAAVHFLYCGNFPPTPDFTVTAKSLFQLYDFSVKYESEPLVKIT